MQPSDTCSGLIFRWDILRSCMGWSVGWMTVAPALQNKGRPEPRSSHSRLEGNGSIDQSVNQSIDRSIDRSNQPVDRWIDGLGCSSEMTHARATRDDIHARARR